MTAVMRIVLFAVTGAILGAVYGWVVVESSTMTVCSIGESTCPPWVNLDGEELSVGQALAIAIPKGAAVGAVAGLILSRLARRSRFPALAWTVIVVATLGIVLGALCELLHPGEPTGVDLCVPFVFGVAELLFLPAAVIAFVVDVRRNRTEYGTWFPRGPRRRGPREADGLP
jgi:hypothetical protein